MPGITTLFCPFDEKVFRRRNSFLEGSSPTYADSEKGAIGWPFEAIGDPLRLYARDYGVLSLPAYIVTDASGRILAEDHLFENPSISLDSLRSIFRSIQNNSHIKKTTAVGTLRSANGLPTAIGTNYALCLFKHTKKVAILDASLRRLYIADSSGLILRQFDVSLRYPIKRLSWYKTDSSLMLGQMNPRTNSLDVFQFNVFTGHVSRIKYNVNVFPKGCGTICLQANPITGNLYTFVYPLYFKSKFRSRDRVIAEFRPNGMLKRSFGTADSIFLADSIAFFEQTYYDFDSMGHVYIWESPSEYLHVYDSNGALMRTLPLAFGRTWQPQRMRFSGVPDNSFWLTYDTTTSRGSNIFVSNDEKRVTIIYYNLKFPPGTVEEDMLSISYHYVVHSIRLDYAGADASTDVILPENIQPYAVTASKIFAAKYEANQLKLYEFPIN